MSKTAVPLDLTFVAEAVADIGDEADAVIPILQAIQEHYRYLPPEALRRVSELTHITPAALTGVSTFYDHFRHRPIGRHLIRVCEGTACHVKGSPLVREAVAQHLDFPTPAADTDTSGEFTVQSVACLGCCTLAPVVQIDQLTYARLTPRGLPLVIDKFRQAQQNPNTRRGSARRSVHAAAGEIRVGLGSCCVAQGSRQVYDAIDDLLCQTGAAAALKRVGCVGMCHQTPLVELVESNGTPHLYAHVRAENVRGIVLGHFPPTGIVRRILSSTSKWLDRVYSDEPPTETPAARLDVREKPVCGFLGPQQRIATEYCGHLDPLDLDEYMRHGGFAALRCCVQKLTADKVITEIERSGLRGRGGAGFPTFVKWDKLRRASDPVKYVICNGDEGDPGAFMDRMLLESFPYRIIEGLSIAALATGATEGMFYIRAEYPLAVQRIRRAVRACAERGLLGPSILDSGFRLNLTVKEGAGAFICGEETALIHSLEGGRGTPHLRPPYPVEHGLHGHPTLINNVETLALVPWIMRHGADAFAALGTVTSKGTKVFSLAGKVQRGGLIEVPMGVTLREIVEDIGGGVAPGRVFKAVQVGGPSGGCVPAELADTPVDYEALAEVGAIMGSGGLVVLDDTDCMVDIARYFLRFTQNQSCGKCTFCRIGTKRMLDILDRICRGRGRADDLSKLGAVIRASSPR